MHAKRTGLRLVGLVILIFLVLFIVQQPHNAAHTTSNIGTWLLDAGNSIGNFLTTIFT